MADMNAQDMDMMKKEAGMEQKPGKVVEVAQSTGQGLAFLASELQKAGSDEDKAKMAQLIQLYNELLEDNLAEKPEDEAMPADQGVVSAQGGMNGMPMGPNTRQ